jgi:uncharacterized membrane protein YqaE (UPF0057 family)
MDLLRIIIAILLPPLGVFLQVGIGKQFWINILLTLLGLIRRMFPQDHAVIACLAGRQEQGNQN